MNPTEDPIEALLREENHYVEDNGFTQRVITALPRRRREWFRPVILLSAITIGSGLAMRWLPWGNLPSLNSSDWLAFNSQLPPLWLPGLVVATVVGTLAWSAVAALQWED